MAGWFFVFRKIGSPLFAKARMMQFRQGSLPVFAWLKGLAQSLPRSTRWLMLFSLAINLLLLVAPLYMLQVYDRVLTSGSLDTLIWLTVIAVFLLSVYGAAEAGRRRLSAVAGQQLEQTYAERAFRRFGSKLDEPGALPRDLGNAARLAGPLSSGTILAFCDLPFSPLFMIVLAMIHPILGILGLAGGAAVFALAVAAEAATRDPSERTSAVQAQASRYVEGLARQRSALIAMGLVERARDLWAGLRQSGAAIATDASRKESLFTAISRAARQILQIIMLCAGAWLALEQQISPGGIVASSIVLSRALAPVDLIVGSWRGLVQARTAWRESNERMGELATEAPFLPLPRPAAQLSLDRVAARLPGNEVDLIRPFSAEIAGGSLIALTGNNGSGKTTLLQTLAGAWPIAGGVAMLGGRSIHAWPDSDRGQYVGYLPQDVELLPATIAQNIARLNAAPPEAIIAAAEAAGAHQTILGLPDGYETLIGPGGAHLSAGQRQAIGLARVLFGDPVLMLLDEPSAHLDEAAAASAIASIKGQAARGAIVLVATHDPRLLTHATQIYTIAHGTITAHAPQRRDIPITLRRKEALV
jgi:PrtD family type I secretion system ABC transporter